MKNSTPYLFTGLFTQIVSDHLHNKPSLLVDYTLNQSNIEVLFNIKLYFNTNQLLNNFIMPLNIKKRFQAQNSLSYVLYLCTVDNYNDVDIYICYIYICIYHLILNNSVYPNNRPSLFLKVFQTKPSTFNSDNMLNLDFSLFLELDSDSHLDSYSHYQLFLDLQLCL